MLAPDAPHDPSLLVYSASLSMAVFQVEASLARVEAIARASGGYLVSRADREITVRVPRASFEAALAQIEKSGDVLHRAIQVDDVTDEYVDVEVRLRNARALRDRLEKLLGSATVSEATALEAQLARVTEQIEQMEGRLALLRDRTAYSQIAVAFQAAEAQPVKNAALLPFAWMQDLGLASLMNVGATP